MALRAGHGKGAGQPRIEVLPADELPAGNAHDTAGHLAERQRRGRPFEKGNRAGVGRRPKLALLGVPIDAADPRYALALRRASRYRKRRCAELATTHGYVSAGVSSLIASASLALCGSRYLYELAATTGDADTLKRASALANDARQNELAAWELAAREGAARPKENALAKLRREMGFDGKAEAAPVARAAPAPTRTTTGAESTRDGHADGGTTPGTADSDDGREVDDTGDSTAADTGDSTAADTRDDDAADDRPDDTADDMGEAIE